MLNVNVSLNKLCKEILVLCVLATSFFIDYSRMSERNFCIFLLIDIAIVQISLYDRENPINMFYFFVTFSALFHFGQVVLFVFDIPIVVSNAYDLFAIYSYDRIGKTLDFCIKGYNIIAFSGFFIYNRKKPREVTTELTKRDDQEIIYRFGKGMFWILLLPLLVYDISMFRLGLAYGYEAKYLYNNSLLISIDVYFPFSIICILMAAPKEDKTWKYYYAYALVRMALHMFIVGNRGPLIINLVLYEVIRYYYRNFKHTKMAFGKKMALIVGGLVICTFVSYVAVSRGKSNISFSDFLIEYNVISLFLSEFGSTLITAILTVSYTGKYGFLMGKTYLGGLAALLPFSQSYMGDIRSYMNVGALMNPYSPNEGALGGSYFGDMYINFGYYGLWVALGLGIGVAVLFCKMMDTSKINFSKCTMFYFFYSLLLYIRGRSQDWAFAVKRIIYLAIVYCLYRFVVEQREKNHKRSSL